MQFAKIKYDYKKVHLEWLENLDDEYTVKCKDEPLVSFKEALKDFVPHLMSICEIEGDEDSFEIRGLSLSESEKGQGITITGLKTLSSGKKLVINTPHIFDEEWDGELIDCVNNLTDEARKYARGKRATKQENLFEQASKEQRDGALTVEHDGFGNPILNINLDKGGLEVLEKAANQMKRRGGKKAA